MIASRLSHEHPDSESTPARGSPERPDGEQDGQRGRPPGKRARVPALAPEDRKAALIAATIPLLKQHGLTVTTRQIATAAGVAEGTIFGVFRDKAALVNAAIAAAFEPTRVVRALRAIDPGLDLRHRLEAAADILREHIAGNVELLHAVRSSAPESDRTARVDVAASRYLILYELAAVIEPDAAALRRSPSTVARLLLALVSVPRHGFGDPEVDESAEIVSLLLDGLLARPTPPRDPGELPC